jgi:cell wall-associated NlpC family hydrolase
MSFSDTVGQIDQILQWEQQLGGGSSAATPADATAATGGVDATGATTSTGSSGNAATFADALAQAQASEDSTLLSSGGAADSAESTSADSSSLLSGGDSQLLTALSSLESESGTSSVAAQSGGAATSADDPRIEAMAQEASSLVGKPYVWGGGHDGWGTQTGYDCSGFVSAVLHAGGYLSSPQDTTSLPSATGMEAGPGQYVTVYDRDEPGQEGHVIIDINGQFYESGGEHGSWGGGGGVQQISTPSAAYLSTFNVILHPEGL